VPSENAQPKLAVIDQFQKAWCRNRLAFATGAAVAVVLLLGIVVSSWQAVRAKRAEQLAREHETKAQTEKRLAQDNLARAQEEARRNLYAANMYLVRQAWDQNNVGRVRELLAETATNPERGFESAKVWEAATGKELLTLKGHSRVIHSVAFCPDGQRIVTGSWDGTAKVWEAATPAQVARWQAEEQAAAERLATLLREESVRARALRAKDPGAIKQ
jgi:hypothetical protein